jgi:hypothetical protein
MRCNNTSCAGNELDSPSIMFVIYTTDGFSGDDDANSKLRRRKCLPTWMLAAEIRRRLPISGISRAATNNHVLSTLHRINCPLLLPTAFLPFL